MTYGAVVFDIFGAVFQALLLFAAIVVTVKTRVVPRLMDLLGRLISRVLWPRLVRRMGTWQAQVSDRAHARGDKRAAEEGWQVTHSTGLLGFGARAYRDARFDARRQS